jgi:hypothetical protein
MDLEPFAAGTDCPRPDAIGQPFSVENFSVATDGKMIVAVSRKDDIPENPRAPQNILDLLQQPTTLTYWFLPELEKASVQCDSCQCLVTNYKYIPTPQGWLGPDTLKKLALLQNVRIHVEPEFHGDCPIHFTFEGGIGCCMPIRAGGILRLEECIRVRDQALSGVAA